MINFNSNSTWDLKPIDISSVRNEVLGLLIDGEEIASAFKTCLLYTSDAADE